MSLQFSKTERGNRVLCHEGYEYLERKDRRGLNGQEFWRCRRHKEYRCKACIVTEGDAILRGPGNHSHPSDIVGLGAREVQAHVRELAATVGSSTRNVLGMALQSTSADVLQRLPKRHSLEDNVRRVRRKSNPVVANPSSRSFVIPEQYADLILYDSGADDPARILAVGHSELLGTLRSSDLYLADGTFAISPSVFFQLYTIHGLVGASYPPCIYFLLTNKTEETYKKMLRALKGLVPTASPSTVLVDFEMAAINAFRVEFPSAEVKCCFFHLSQSVQRKVGEFGLKRQFDTDPEFSTNVKCLPALAFVPEGQLGGIFSQISGRFPDDGGCNELLSYFERTYIGQLIGGRQTSARFPPALWNQFEAAVECFPKTTNAVEGFHNALQGMFLCQHPSVWKLLDGLRSDIAVHRLTIANAGVGLVVNRRRKYQELARRLASKVANFGAEEDKLHYLRAIAHMQG